MAVTCTLCPVAQDYTGLVLFAVGFGVFDGCFVLLLAITTSDIVGPGKLPAGLGSLYGVIAFPMTFGPPLAGMFVCSLFFYCQHAARAVNLVPRSVANPLALKR